MRHLDDGDLRRLIDEPLAASEADRVHLDGCEACRSRSGLLATEAAGAARRLAVPAFEPDAARALNLVRNRSAVAPAHRRAWARFSWNAPRTAAPLALVAAVVTIGALAFAASPSVLTIFKPDQGVKTVSVTPPAKGELTGLPDLSQYGTTRIVTKGTTQAVLSADEAHSLSGLTVPATPASYAGQQVTYTVVGKSVVSFTFSAAKATAAAAAAGKPAPVFPAGIDGTTLTLTAGPAVGEVFGTIDKNTSLSNLPLIEGVANTPVVTSTGVSAAELENFLVLQPGIASNPTLVAEIKAIGEPLAAGNLVIPIPAGMATSTPETINGNSAVLIADNTGTAKGLVWEQSGLVYAVAGHLDDGQLLAIANGI
ncbi:MAG TPA: hypothetical protein VNG93_11185 [Candidatus Dormibacteraeota bacterium]|nr:hypothetical protein [Candidatus Dormibacteraeota bacterium]